jgi:hypothetical protein
MDLKVIRLIWLSLALIFPFQLHAAESTPRPNPFTVSDEAAFFALMDLSRPELARVRDAVAAKDWAAAKQAWANHLASRTSPHWVWSRRDRAAIQRIYQEKFGGLTRYTNAANQVLARDFELLGVRKQLGQKMEWLHGPIEWTHVLSRFGYWQEMGRAYWGTTNAAYARDVAQVLKDWVASNPVPPKVSNSRGTNGSVWRTLETGIRGQVWFDVLELFMDAPEFDAEAKYLLTRSMVEHARYLTAWTTTFRSGNWQVCEATGLATIGIMLPELKEAAGWRELGLQYLVEHMQKDVEPDGAHWELTPGYHTWVMYQFMSVALLCRANGIEVPELLTRHEKMFEFLQKLSRPDASYPAVGDAGHGTKTVSDSMGRGAVFHGRPDFRYLGPDTLDEGSIWQFGVAAWERYAGMPSRRPSFDSVLLPSSQYAVMRTGWGRDDKYLLFDCAPWHGGHSHHDRLQVTVFAGRDLIIDSGMCSYDQPWQKDLRKSAAHNVLVIDGAEQLQADPKVLAWHTGPAADFASGKVEKDGLAHQRSVLFVKPDYWVVVDHVTGTGPHEVTRLFHFPPGKVNPDAGGVVTAFTKGMNIRVQPVDGARIELGTSQIAKGSVTPVDAPVARLISKGDLPMTLCTVLAPFSKPGEQPTIKSVSGGDPQVARLTVEFRDGRKDEIALGATPGPLKLGSEQAQTQAIVRRQGTAKPQVIVIPAGIQ